MCNIRYKQRLVIEAETHKQRGSAAETGAGARLPAARRVPRVRTRMPPIATGFAQNDGNQASHPEDLLETVRWCHLHFGG